MKMNKYIAYIGILCLCLAACSRMEDGPEGRNVMMKVSVGDVAVGTKAVTAKPYEGSDPGENPLGASLWFSLQSGQYATAIPTDTDTYIPCHTDVTFTTSDITPILYNGNETQALKYPTNGDYIYCVGFYPQDVWSWDATYRFTAELTGSEDLMFAPEIRGKWDAQFGTSADNSLRFSHLLTWFKVVICAYTHDAARVWGAINSISLSTASQVRVTKADGTAVSFAGEQVLTIMDAPIELSINQEEAGSIFCAPSSAITLNITTIEGITATKEMTVQGGFKAGYQYVMLLYFNELAIVDGICTLNSWDNQNDNLYLN